MATQIPDEVFVVYFEILEWEDVSNENLFISLFDFEETIFLLMDVARALKKDSPPDIATDPRDYALFIINVFVESASDFGINNIKSIIQVPDRNDIADAAEIVLGQDPSTWPDNALANEQLLINELLDPPVGPAAQAGAAGQAGFVNEETRRRHKKEKKKYKG